ncbi:response regulator [Sphingobacterium faecium]|uniref:response regulator n=1 Tax=Sphingobacterium faecium TaxID=34087 RepID=UPI00247B1D90|nr:response regulator [Sphingobacterium faecium]WGQ14521.1 response regulator [Sphingobacterium faecium]
MEKIKILVLEDSEHKKSAIESIISTDDVDPTYCTNIIDCENSLADLKYDLLILDMKIPRREGEESISKGGIEVLDKLYLDDELNMPTRIIALTRYDDLQSLLNEKYGEIAVLKYEEGSIKWSESLKRTIVSLLKAKNIKIIHCEGSNFEDFNSLKLRDIEFRSVNDCREVFLQVCHNISSYAIRDRDFLVDDEITLLKARYPNLYILDYYCYENYLYHPDNLNEAISNFDKSAYIQDLIQQKNLKKDNIILDIKDSRKGYTEFKHEIFKIAKTKNAEQSIIQNLKSDQLENFYKFFDMAGKKDKGHQKSYNKEFLNKYSFNKTQLFKTVWFKTRIGQLIA